MSSRAVENYLRALYEIIEKKGSARPKDLVRNLNVSAPSVTEMLQKLAELKLINYQKRKEISLTEKGRKKAIALKARYQIFLKLFKMAGVSSATAYADSCRIENQLSAETVSKLVEFMERLEKTMLCKKL
ncbi:MAG: metal-dependent transcriptional regulator [Candidatus Micrarchaeota archaeon]|nr:metal-dependent transcriptional regulator [Candidatus Micrarchaeota archaeon]